MYPRERPRYIPGRTRRHPAAMPDDLAPPKPRQRGNSRAYIVARLRREGFDDWAVAVETGRISAFALACDLGWTRRPPTLLGEDTNQAKRRRYALAQLRD